MLPDWFRVKLGSAAEVTNSSYGPNLSFFNNPDVLNVIGNPGFVSGVFGNGVTIAPGSYNFVDREHTVVWSNLNQYLNPNRGTIECWYKQNEDPVLHEIIVSSLSVEFVRDT